MPKPAKRRAFLVSELSKRDVVRVYAVLAVTADEALEAVALQAAPDAEVEIVGGLSRDLVKRLRLEPGEVRQV
ncbi:hypothetical protein LOK46_24145 [Methylobacterium sp. NMS14P]|uniref:hypothetical protein n=1 Tax=unclassified Methylobacterium TaxID=2615210 RepID=UPI0023581E00|nr:hypothetical protein [Methylobacterium sp. NMS14P]WCS24200.1 hypothetical protein LOK46_24145 [Methylobacterium sp. NMS14P]